MRDNFNINDFNNQCRADEIKHMKQVDGILDKRIRYIENRVWLMFKLAFVLIIILFCFLLVTLAL